ncbi:biofilm regulation phosphoprotein SiaC [Mesoterricola silvestris]|uniref:SiaC family regulatory phosphoprotein domain-containing protein n=1 Tax=Mesoterricola silvestris TaxID=2927979 RepID=A0AA48GQQ4_9BACT|nr:biofilm regulation phosphoprotein SiaC [Mesoterricola silvestris]BDU74369.1 hypothetical protein METEAL_35430 [Mesoterricola silvestris]
MTLENLSVDATVSSPRVRSDAEGGLLELAGESYPENSFEFFQPILTWVADFLAQDERPLRVELRLTYLNTSSIKCMMDLLDALEEAHLSGRAVSLTWYYDPENDRALDLAEEFREDLGLPFEIVPLPMEG